MTHKITQVLCTLNYQNNHVENEEGLINVKSFKPHKFTILLLTLPFYKGPEYFDAFTMLQDFSEANLLISVAFLTLLNTSFSKSRICLHAAKEIYFSEEQGVNQSM